MKRKRDEEDGPSEDGPSEDGPSEDDAGQRAPKAIRSVPAAGVLVYAGAPAVDGGQRAAAERARARSATTCPFLHTVNRRALNFDFEKVCSVTLSTQNVYACLVCGKYFQGRGHGTPAETHSVQAEHFVFINLADARIFCLPDNYQVEDSSLQDIQSNLLPKFSAEAILRVDESASTPRTDVFGTAYVPGFSPMNDLSGSDFVNAALQALAHVAPLRDFFLDANNYSDSNSLVVRRFGETMCKLWNPAKLKASVSANEFMEAVSAASGGQFRLGKQADCADFIKWLLHELHTGLGGSRKPGSSVIHLCFQGQVQVSTQEIPKNLQPVADELDGIAARDKAEAIKVDTPIRRQVVPALMFALELPNSPLFRDSREGKSLVPEIDMSEALAKYGGGQYFDTVREGRVERRTYRIVKLPPYVIFHVNRFIRTGWGVEKNRTILKLEVTNLDLSPFVGVDAPSDSAGLSSASVVELKSLAAKHGVDTAGVVEKHALAAKVQAAISNASRSAQVAAAKGRGKSQRASKRVVAVPSLRPVGRLARYDLVSNICHKTVKPTEVAAGTQVIENGTYLAHALNQSRRQWYELSNLDVNETMPQLIACSESYIAIYRNTS